MPKKFTFIHYSPRVKDIYTAEVLNDKEVRVSWDTGSVIYPMWEAKHYLKTGAWSIKEVLE